MESHLRILNQLDFAIEFKYECRCALTGRIIDNNKIGALLTLSFLCDKNFEFLDEDDDIRNYPDDYEDYVYGWLVDYGYYDFYIKHLGRNYKMRMSERRGERHSRIFYLEIFAAGDSTHSLN